MQKQMRDTSLTAFLILQPQLGERQQITFNTIREHPEKTAYELAKILGHNDPNFVRPRITELNKAGYIYSPYTRICEESESLAHVWRISPHLEATKQ